MGVDSGLPCRVRVSPKHRRGPEGCFPLAGLPALPALGLRFEELADPVHFADDPALAWGFYGHRLALYRSTVPHAGFAVLRRWARERPTRVLTSNVDGQFQAAGFDPDVVAEVHGSIHGSSAWPAAERPCGPRTGRTSPSTRRRCTPGRRGRPVPAVAPWPGRISSSSATATGTPPRPRPG